MNTDMDITTKDIIIGLAIFLVLLAVFSSIGYTLDFSKPFGNWVYSVGDSGIASPGEGKGAANWITVTVGEEKPTEKSQPDLSVTITKEEEPSGKKNLMNERRYKMEIGILFGVAIVMIIESIALAIATFVLYGKIFKMRRKEKGHMGKPKMFGMNKTFIPNSKADQKRNKPFTGAHKKGKAKK